MYVKVSLWYTYALLKLCMHFVCELYMSIIVLILFYCILQAYMDESQYDLMVLNEAYSYNDLFHLCPQVCIYAQ